MRFRSLRTLAAGAVALVLLAGGATALAKSGSTASNTGLKSERSRFATGFARELVAASGARRMFVTGAAADCRIAMPLGDPRQAAADYLGLSVEELDPELQAGKSLAEIASEHGKSVDGLEQAVIDAAKADLDKRVAAGDITAEQEQQLLSDLRSHVDDLVNATGGPPFAPPAPPLGDPIAAAAEYLGLSVDLLDQEMQAGKSLADVAKAQGKSVDGLEQAVIAEAKAALDKSVAAGDITADDEQQILGQVSAQVGDFVDGNGGLEIRIGDKDLSVRVGGPLLDGPYRIAADYLGLSVDELTKELQDGKSLADIATEHGKSVDGLKQALVQAATAEIEQSVDDLVNQKGLAGPPCGDAVVAAVGVQVSVPGLAPPGTP
jgi:lambda repressor-like predicted transcriptional regulator